VFVAHYSNRQATLHTAFSGAFATSFIELLAACDGGVAFGVAWRAGNYADP